MKSERKHLSMESLISSITKEFVKIKDPGQRSKYEIKDCLLAGLGMFYLKMNSLLQFITEVKSNKLVQNLMNLYGIGNIPSDTHFRVRLDEIEYNRMQYVYDALFAKLQRSKILDQYHYYEDYCLVAIDGTGYFHSDKINCINCCVKNHKNGSTSYYHQALAAVMVSPNIKEVIPLSLEPIIKQDGVVKNDCELNAAKRLVLNLRKSHPNLKMILVIDALYANTPFIKLLEEEGYKYIITYKKTDLYEESFRSGTLEYKVNNSKEYRFASSSLKSGVKVNYLEFTHNRYHNSWITNLPLDDLDKVVTCGRSRWSIENETFNTLKNQGYNFEHNYGHGNKNLSIVMCHLMFIAFAIDQIQAYCGYYFKKVLKVVHAKKYVWEKIRNAIQILSVSTWDEFYIGMLNLFNRQDLLCDT